MGATKLNSILKKYKRLYKKHKDSWGDAQEKIRTASQKIQEKMNTHEYIYTCEKTYMEESHNYHLRAEKLLDAFMKELEGQEVFPKKVNSKILNEKI